MKKHLEKVARNRVTELMLRGKIGHLPTTALISRNSQMAMVLIDDLSRLLVDQVDVAMETLENGKLMLI